VTKVLDSLRLLVETTAASREGFFWDAFSDSQSPPA
jgi:hypothetical protein